MVNKGAIAVGAIALGGLLVFALTRKAGATGPPAGWTATSAQMDELRANGFSESEIDRWKYIAYERVMKLLKPGEVVGWSPLMGYYAMPATYYY